MDSENSSRHLSHTFEIAPAMLDEPSPVDKTPAGHPNIPAAMLARHVERLHANSNRLFSEEYQVRGILIRVLREWTCLPYLRILWRAQLIHQ